MEKKDGKITVRVYAMGRDGSEQLFRHRVALAPMESGSGSLVFYDDDGQISGTYAAGYWSRYEIERP